ncbi:MAG: hypothetical protein J6Q89_04560 [Clostridia bacterium]|nr:hypothetical protein [Clostridia bacterium]
MKDNNIFIKERHPELFTKGFTLLALMIASLLCAFAPFLASGLQNNKKEFYLIGGLLFVIFTVLFVRLIYKEFYSSNLLILSSNGFIDNKNVGPNIEIEWTNVSSVKLLGNDEMPYLGISLDNCDIVMAKMKKHVADEMRDNIDDNLPHILIAQNEVYTPVNELKDTFVRFIKESRILNREANQKPKNNPFTTDDVLRAFGKLPPEDNSVEQKSADCETDATNAESTKPEIVKNLPVNEVPTEKIIDINIHNDIEPTADSENTVNLDLPDSFCEFTQNNIDNSSEIPEDVIPTSSNEDDFKNALDTTNISDEINEFLAHAKFSKIDELNKMLNEKDVPYSAVRDDKSDVSGKEDKKEIIEDITNTESKDENTDVEQEPQEASDNYGITSFNYNNDFSIDFPAELYDENEIKVSNDDITFETLIQQTKEFDSNDISNENQDL